MRPAGQRAGDADDPDNLGHNETVGGTARALLDWNNELMLIDAANGWKPGSIAQRLRQARLALFCDLVRDMPQPIRVLDVGGTHQFWLAMDRTRLPRMQITFLNMWF